MVFKNVVLLLRVDLVFRNRFFLIMVGAVLLAEELVNLSSFNKIIPLNVM